MKKRPNLKNFFYLVGSGLTIQLAGTIYRIWLARKIGAEGLGILQMVYPVYRLLSGLAAIGLPIALTKWISEYLVSRDYSKIIALRKWAVKIVVTSSIIIGVLLYLSAPVICQKVFTDKRVYESLIIVAFAIPFSALSSIYRGYFQGFSLMAPTATSEITEQLLEISITIFLILTTTTILPWATCSYPVIGLTFGEVTCLATLLIFLKHHQPNSNPTSTELIIPYQKIFRYSWPLLLNQIVVSISFASEGVIIPHLLISSGYKTAISTGLFGKLTGMAEPIAYFPLIFLAPLGAVLSPQISAAYKSKTFEAIRSKISLFYLASTGICLLSYWIILFAAKPISQLLYNDISPVLLIKLLVIGLPFTGFAILNISFLAAIGATDQILWVSIWAMGLKTFLLVVLTPLWGIEGCAWTFNITQIFIALVSLVELWPLLPSNVEKTCPRSLPPSHSLALIP